MASEKNPAQFISASELALPLTVMLVLAGMVAPIGATILDVMLSLSLALWDVSDDTTFLSGGG